MKGTSRRTFARQLTAGLAALPLINSMVEAKEQKAKAPQENLREHDTPPPALFTPGSFIFEANTNKNDWDAFLPIQSNTRRQWSVIPNPYPDGGTSPTDIYIAHVKLVTGAGDMLFHYDNDNTTDARTAPIHITATMKKMNGTDFGDCHLTATGNHFEIDLPNLKKLKPKNNDPSSNQELRPKRVRYMHDAGDDVCNWTALKINKGTVNLFNITDLNNLPGYRDMKLMIWWENLS